MEMEQTTTTRPEGRPTDYKPEYCDMVVEWGRQGKSRAWICSQLFVVRQTLKNWEAAHPEFLVAMEHAKLGEQRYYEDAGQAGMYTKEFNASIWSRSMAARFPDEWREKSEVDMNNRVEITEVKRTIVDTRD